MQHHLDGLGGVDHQPWSRVATRSIRPETVFQVKVSRNSFWLSMLIARVYLRACGASGAAIFRNY